MEIKKWEDIKDKTYDAIILGNGASIAVSTCFSYGDLFKVMQEQKKLSDNIEKVFEYLGTSDFELVLNRIWHSYHINQALEITDEKTILAYTEIRKILIQAVRENHVEFNYAQFHLGSIYKFLQEFKTVISLNYDLIVYWAMLYGNRELGTWFKDCFIHGEFSEEWEDLRKPYQANGSTLVFYPHGNLILARTIYGEEEKLVIKAKFEQENTDNLLSSIFNFWEDNKKTPIFVSEGDSKQKLKAIRRSSYLSLVYDKVLPEIGGEIVIYGWSLAEQDQHIIKQLCNKSIETLAISIFTDRPSDQIKDEIIRMRSTIKKYNPTVKVIFFDSSSAGCWINS